ncbi:hypothetical protein CBR_g526 [Chara braunii]|uniref:DUF659 domain-containing protein n=1 Tax=Chara braunii TaxID=69332 RepID=A0A388KBI3_CHABU|nr:hypothetical protein CBR_g526 [Chara braunii]|eukprot:GBG67389.1 hypothetical protein CBR_g526 [Chara braunii]
MSKPATLNHLQEQLKKHFTIEGTPGKHVGKGSKYWKCNYCDLRLAGTATRLRDHFLDRCTLDNVTVQLSVEERARREAGMSEGKCIARMLMQIEAGGAGPSNMPTASSHALEFLSSQVVGAGSTGETATPQSTGATALGSKPSSGRPLRQTVIEEADSVVTMNERTSRFLDQFLICTNQPFSLVEDVFFLEFLEAVRTAHPTWMPCRRDEQRTKRLDAEYARVGAEVRAMVVKWKKTGCMLQMDGWSDRRNKPHLNVMVSSPVGTVFWKSVCMEGKEKDSTAYFRVLDNVIKEIGADAVVGVVMDNARVCVKAGKMVETAYPTIFSVGCTAHALDLALEDMYKEMPWMAQVVTAGNKTKLKRPLATRFATNFEMLQSLNESRKPLGRCVCDKGWVDKMVRNDQLVAFHDVTAIVLDTGDFWRNLQKALDVMQPVVELLRLVDGQGATISKVYFKMNQVVQNLWSLESLSVEEHEAVARILMGRWAFLTSELHCAAAFLDPEHRMHNAQRDPEVCVGFNIWLYFWMPRERRQEVSSQVDQWVNALGGFSTEQAREQACDQPPALWREAFGLKHDLLAPQAIRLLGQASSSAACERNWSLHELIYGWRRTKLLPERMAKLVYISWNVRLLRRNQRGEGDEIHIPWADDVPVDREMEEWYVHWLDRVHDDVHREEVVEVDCDDEGDEIPMRRTFMQNDEVDDKLVEEEETLLVGTRQRDWHECTKPGKHREQELRRRSGCQLPGRDEARTKRRGKDKGKQTVEHDDAPAQRGKRKAVQQEQPRPKRGHPTNAKQAARKVKKAEEKAMAAAAEAKAAADKASAAKAKAAAKAAKKSARGGKAKKSVVVSDDDEEDVPEESPEEDEPEGSSTSTSTESSSSSASSSSHTSGMEGTNGEGSEGGEEEGEDQVEAE